MLINLVYRKSTIHLVLLAFTLVTCNKGECFDFNKAVELFSENEAVIRKNTEIDFTVNIWNSKNTDLNKLVDDFKRFSSGAFTNDHVLPIKKQLEESYPSSSAIHWRILFYNGNIKFETRNSNNLISDPEADREIVNHIDKDWLYTADTVYEKSELSNVVKAKKINPLNEKYPYPLDILHLGLGIFSMQAFTNAPDMNFEFIKTNDGSELRFPSTDDYRVRLIFDPQHNLLLPKRFEIGRNKLNQVRYFRANKINKDTNLYFPFSMSQLIKYGNSSVELITITSIKHGKLTADDMRIGGDINTRIIDELPPE